MTTLQINHINGSPGSTPQFEVQADNGKRSPAVSLTPPTEQMVAGISLLQGLTWYLEEFFSVSNVENFCTRADAVQAALKEWGRDCFDALFQGHARDWYHEAWRGGLQNLTLKIASDDPGVLGWPWEALYSDDDGYIALQCRIERELHRVPDPLPCAAELPQDQLNILYVIARPQGDRDVGFRTMARPLIDCAAQGRWPVQVDVLRPPTFAQLCAVLAEKTNFYHIVHFDGHGHAPDAAAGQDGALVFEKEYDPTGEGDPIPAASLRTLLHDYNVPYMVLNACWSATMGRTRLLLWPPVCCRQARMAWWR